MTKSMISPFETAKIIFDIWGPDKVEIDRILTALRAHNTDRSNDIACSIEYVIDKYADENDLCPECLHDEFHSKQICFASLGGPEEWSFTCRKCGWSN